MGGVFQVVINNARYCMAKGEWSLISPNTLHLGDCLEVMADIEDSSIDMILADNPYGTTACSWDSIIPLEPLWQHYKRVIKPRGAIVLTASQPFTSVLVMSNLEWFKYEWVWEKDKASNFMVTQYQPLKYHENILVFGDGSICYNPVKVDSGKIPNKSGTAKKIKIGGAYNDLTENNNYKLGSIKNPSSIQKFYTPKSNDKDNGCLHPTQKPVALFAYLIRTYTNPGELVLDNAIGSGTTAIAAIETGRQWIGIEKEAEYYEIARKRIEDRLKQPFLPGIMPSKVQHKQMELTV